MGFSYPIPPQNVSLTEDYLIRLKRVVTQIMRGKTNNVGAVTLDANQDSTDVADVNVGSESAIFFMPLTANAALEDANGSLYAAPAKQSFTIYHDNNAQTDRDFKYVVIG